MSLKPEILVDIGLENWADPTHLVQWAEGTGGGSVNQESSIVHGGTYAARFDKTSQANCGIWRADSSKYAVGKWFRYEMWSRGDGVSTECMLRVWNATKSKYWNPATQSWQAGTAQFLASITTAWVRNTLWWRMDPTFDLTDAIQIHALNWTDATGSTYVDDFSVVGPYDVPVANVTGTILDPNGDPLENDGVISVRLNGVGYVLDGAGNNLMVPPVVRQFPIDNGVVNMDLIPTDKITLQNGGAPRWFVNYNIKQFDKLSEIWNLGLVTPIDLVQVTKE